MKFSAISLLATLAAASPIAAPDAAPGITISADGLEARQFGSSTSNELEQGQAGSCPRVIFVYARGSTEAGNLGTLGGSVGDGLKSTYGRTGVWVQGVGGPYRATLGDNALPRGSSSTAIREMVRLLALANTKCPNAAIVAGGYSQGAALAAAAITDSSTTVREKIAGTVLFGYTKNLQNRGAIPSYPSDRLKVFCATGDLVCTGTLTITAAHLSYGDEARSEAPRFLASKVGA